MSAFVQEATSTFRFNSVMVSANWSKRAKAAIDTQNEGRREGRQSSDTLASFVVVPLIHGHAKRQVTGHIGMSVRYVGGTTNRDSRSGLRSMRWSCPPSRPAPMNMTDRDIEQQVRERQHADAKDRNVSAALALTCQHLLDVRGITRFLADATETSSM